MKVVHVTEALSGGVFSFIFQLSNALVEQGVDVTVVYSRRPETPHDLDTYFLPQVRLIELPMRREVSPLADLAACIRLWRTLRNVDADAIHLHSSKAGILGRAAAKLPGVRGKVFYSPHGLAFLRMDVSPFVRQLYKLFERGGAFLGGVVVASSASEMMHIQQDIPGVRTTLVNNGVDLSGLPERAGNDSDKLHILTINRISPQKDPSLFARVATAVSKSGVVFEWVGGGDADGRRELEAAGVTVYGWMPLAEALSKLAHCDIFLQTSRWEGMPIILIQAQAIGIPAVVTDVVGNRDVVIDGKTGFVCPDEQALIAKLQELCDDRTLRENLGQEARTHARSLFSIERMTSEYMSLYQG